MPRARVHGELLDQQPQGGDVVISRQPLPSDAFGISQVPGTVQLTASRRNAAAELARGFAHRHGVDVWEKRGDTYSLLASCRRKA